MERYESWLDRAISSFEIAGTRNSNLVYYEDLCGIFSFSINFS
jgi:hypothetical protein